MLGPAPHGHCEGCHKRGHFWKDCFSRPQRAEPKHLQKGQGKAQGWRSNRNPRVANPAAPSTMLVVSAQAATMTAEANGNRGMWLIDSGASFNFTPHLSDFMDTLEEPQTSHVRVGDGARIVVKGMGSVQVHGKDGGLLALTKVH